MNYAPQLSQWRVYVGSLLPSREAAQGIGWQDDRPPAPGRRRPDRAVRAAGRPAAIVPATAGLVQARTGLETPRAGLAEAGQAVAAGREIRFGPKWLGTAAMPVAKLVAWLVRESLWRCTSPWPLSPGPVRCRSWPLILGVADRFSWLLASAPWPLALPFVARAPQPRLHSGPALAGVPCQPGARGSWSHRTASSAAERRLTAVLPLPLPPPLPVTGSRVCATA